MDDKQSNMLRFVPLDWRMETNFLRLTRNSLVDEQGFAKTSVNHDFHTKTLSIGGDIVAKVVVENVELDVKWLHSNWASWKELRSKKGCSASCA